MHETATPVVELVRWQTATLVASAIAGVEFLVLVVAGVVFLAGPAADGVRAAAPGGGGGRAPARVEQKPERAVAHLSRARTAVLILNGNGVSGAAAAAAEHVQRIGYRVGSVGNATRSDYASSLVMYRRGRQGEGERLARDLHVPLVAPLDGMRAADLHGAHLVLILGSGS
jgi:hypothetical protein